MRIFKNFIYLILIGIFSAAFSQCASTNKQETSLPLKLGDVYYQENGVDATIVIPIISNPNNIVLDSIFFQWKEAKLEFRNNTKYVGRFEIKTSIKPDIIMSNEPYGEYGNKVPEIPRKSRFQLKENECMVSYKQGNSIKYFRIENIKKRMLEN